MRDAADAIDQPCLPENATQDPLMIERLVQIDLTTSF